MITFPFVWAYHLTPWYLKGLGGGDCIAGTFQLPPQKISIIMPIRIKWHCKQFLKNYNAVNEKSQIPQSQLYDHL